MSTQQKTERETIRIIPANSDFSGGQFGESRVSPGTPLLFELPEWRFLERETMFLREIRDRGRSKRPQSAHTYALKLAVFIETLRAYDIKDYNTVTGDLIFAYRNGLQTNHSNSTVNQMIAVVRSLFSWLKRTRQLTEDPFSGINHISLDQTEIPIRAMTRSELGPILCALPFKYRLMARLALCTGLRSFEIIGLRIDDLPCIDTSDQWVELTVTRKGRIAPSIVLCPRKMADELYHWIHLSGRTEIVRTAKKRYNDYHDPGNVFLTKYGMRMSENRFTKEFTKAVKRVHLYQPLRTAHALRHTFGITMLRALVKKNDQYGPDGGMNAVLELRNIMGHRRIESTMKYLTALNLTQDKSVESVNQLYDSYQN